MEEKEENKRRGKEYKRRPANVSGMNKPDEGTVMKALPHNQLPLAGMNTTLHRRYIFQTTFTPVTLTTDDLHRRLHYSC